jgi:hypothetical protein
MVLDLGKLCSQYACVASFIISKLPCSSTDEIVCLVCLCLNQNLRSAPKLSDAIVLFGCICEQCGLGCYSGLVAQGIRGGN